MLGGTIVFRDYCSLADFKLFAADSA